MIVRGLDFLIKESRRAIEELDQSRANEAGNDLQREYSDRPECFYQLAQIAGPLGILLRSNQTYANRQQSTPFYSTASDELIGLMKVQKRHKEAIDILQQRLNAISGKGDCDLESEVRIELWSNLHGRWRVFICSGCLS